MFLYLYYLNEAINCLKLGLLNYESLVEIMQQIIMEQCCKAINGVDRPSFCSIKARWSKNIIVSPTKVVKRYLCEFDTTTHKFKR